MFKNWEVGNEGRIVYWCLLLGTYIHFILQQPKIWAKFLFSSGVDVFGTGEIQ